MCGSATGGGDAVCSQIISGDLVVVAKVLIATFRASVEGLSIFLVTLVTCVMFYSSAIYYAELEVHGSTIHSIPDAFWWAIVTMTTVGYGDEVPAGTAGRLIGAACAVSGILTVAIPVPIIAGQFNVLYTRMLAQARARRFHESPPSATEQQ